MKDTTPTVIVRIHLPDITPEERAKRMERIHQAAANLVLATRKVHRRTT